MDCTVALAQITHYLLRGVQMGEPAPQKALAHVAGCRHCLQTLTELGTLWTDQSSLLNATVDLLTCHECQEMLPAYVDAHRAPDMVLAKHERVIHHLAHCTPCRQQYALLTELVEELALAEASMLHASDVANEQTTSSHAPWRLLDVHIHELIAPLRIRLGQWGAAFAAWPATLSDLLPAPQPATAPLLRHSADTRPQESSTYAVQWIELPDTVNDVLVRVGAGAAHDARATIALKLTTLSAAVPLEHGKVSLRDQGGELLERIATDADGLALFQHLPVGIYRLTVEQGSGQWEVNVLIEEASLSR